MMSLIVTAAMIVPSGRIFQCRPTHVYDGDGPVWCAEGPKVRISGIAAREADGTCRPNQPCPQASAQQARDALVNLFGGPKGRIATGHIQVRSAPMVCRSVGGAGGSRTAAWCTLADGRDLSCAMIATKMVLVWPRYWRDHRCHH